MRVALGEAQKAYQAGEVPIGAVITQKDGEIVARAHNLCEVLHDASAHAEVLAIRRAGEALKNWRLTGGTIYVTVEPCLMCVGAIYFARIKRLVYGCYDSRAGAVGSMFDIPKMQKLDYSIDVVPGILEMECRELMQSFFQDLRNSKKNG